MKRQKFLNIIVIVVFLILISRLYYLQVIKYEEGLSMLAAKTEKVISAETAPRGRIYDRNGKVLVDNKPVKIIYYKKQGASESEEKELAKKMAEIIKEEPEAIFEKMNQGYKYDNKIIKKDVDEYTYAYIAENLVEFPGFDIQLSWDRTYPYGETFRSLLGTVGKIPAEKKNEYLKSDYEIYDTVGLSYLEYQYDYYLKGIKNKYISRNGTVTLKEEGEKGNDLYLTLDIELQKKVEEIIINNLYQAKNELNTRYLTNSFVIVSKPTGEILTLAGKQIIDGKIYDYTTGTLATSVVPGSIVKGASHIVGYNNNALRIGEVRDDTCLNIKSTPPKCSIKYLGVLNDLNALKYSSNTFQFHTAIKVGGGHYVPGAGLGLNENAFDIYRHTFAEFGLGEYTKIDLPNEKLGYTGKSKAPGQLLDFAIGQYDTYTPLQISSYINTIASSGNRNQLMLGQYVKDNQDNIIFDNQPKTLNKVKTNSEYMQRIQEGFKMVMEPGGTGYYVIDPTLKPAGKTGTSQNFIDTNNDKRIDTETITTSFVAYAPYDNPEVTFTVITPNVSDMTSYSYISLITQKIAKEVSNAYFSLK